MSRKIKWTDDGTGRYTAGPFLVFFDNSGGREYWHVQFDYDPQEKFKKKETAFQWADEHLEYIQDELNTIVLE